MAAWLDRQVSKLVVRWDCVVLAVQWVCGVVCMMVG